MASEHDGLAWFVLKHIVENVHCVSCHRRYTPDELQILAHREGTWFIKVSCERCGTEGLIMVVLETRSAPRSPWPLIAAGQDRLLPENQEAPTKPRRPITQQEVEELGRFLDRYHGNLSELWKKN